MVKRKGIPKTVIVKHINELTLPEIRNVQEAWCVYEWLVKSFRPRGLNYQPFDPCIRIHEKSDYKEKDMVYLEFFSPENYESDQELESDFLDFKTSFEKYFRRFVDEYESLPLPYDYPSKSISIILPKEKYDDIYALIDRENLFGYFIVLFIATVKIQEAYCSLFYHYEYGIGKDTDSIATIKTILENHVAEKDYDINAARLEKINFVYNKDSIGGVVNDNGSLKLLETTLFDYWNGGGYTPWYEFIDIINDNDRKVKLGDTFKVNLAFVYDSYLKDKKIYKYKNESATNNDACKFIFEIFDILDISPLKKKKSLENTNPVTSIKNLLQAVPDLSDINSLDIINYENSSELNSKLLVDFFGSKIKKKHIKISHKIKIDCYITCDLFKIQEQLRNIIGIVGFIQSELKFCSDDRFQLDSDNVTNIELKQYINILSKLDNKESVIESTTIDGDIFESSLFIEIVNRALLEYFRNNIEEFHADILEYDRQGPSSLKYYKRRLFRQLLRQFYSFLEENVTLEQNDRLKIMTRLLKPSFEIYGGVDYSYDEINKKISRWVLRDC